MTAHRPLLPWHRHLRELLVLGLPLVGSSGAQFAIHMTDTLMLGWYDVTALAAVTLGSTFFFILFIVGAGFGFAVMPKAAAAAATGDSARVRQVTRMGVWLGLFFALLVLPLMLFSEPLFLLAGQDPKLAALASDYLSIIGFGMAPALAMVTLRSFLSALEYTTVQLVVTVMAVFANAGFNYVLIFGNFGAPELGLQGAAIASVSMQVLPLIGLTVYALRKLPQYALLQAWWRPHWSIFTEVARMGIPIGLTTFAESALFTASAIMMGWLGEIPLAAHGIALQLAGITFMFHVGMSQAATIRTGAAYGRQDRANLQRGAMVAFAVSLAFGTLVVACFIAFPEALVAIFVDTDEPARAAVIAAGATLVLVAAAFQFVDAMQIMVLGVLRGLQDTTVPMFLASISYWLIGMPASYVLGFVLNLGAKGVWIGLVVGLGAAATSMTIRYWLLIRRDTLPHFTPTETPVPVPSPAVDTFPDPQA